ncbi:MAG: F0F1 ATP synthase subunit B [Gemmobacter sp.]
MRRLPLFLVMLATPAQAAEGPFFSLGNSDFTVLIAFILFVAVLVYFKVPALLGGMLDRRAETIRAELDAARALREEAKSLLASFERKSADVKAQAERIVVSARADATAAAEQAKAELARSIERRLRGAEEQIAQAEASAVREVRERAIAVAVAAAGDVLAKQMTSEAAGELIEQSIAEVGARLH